MTAPATATDRAVRRGLGRCALAAVLFGASAPIASRLADDLQPFTLAGTLYVGAALAVLPIVVRRPPAVPALRRGARRLAAAVVAGGAVGPVLLAAGLAHVSAATASLLLNLELAFTIVVAALAFGEHIGWRVAAGTGFVVAGGAALTASGDADLRWGALLIAGACLCWAVDNCVTAALDELAPAHITFAKGAVAGLANLLIGLAFGGVPPLAPALGALAVGAVGYGMSITLWVAGARELGAARAQLVFATAPFLGAVVAWTVLGDAAAGREVAALLLAAIGVTFVLRSAHEHTHAHPAVAHGHEHDHADGHHDHAHAGPVATGERHHHEHAHTAVVHHHPHVPDLHHRHQHADAG